jgi:5-methylcytosine-specific restriction endonuclease McrA
MKLCKKCNERKPENSFAKRAKAKDGLQPYCKECVSAYNRKRYEEKGDKIRAQVMERYRQIGQEEWYGSRRSWYQEYYQKNKERISKRNAEYAKNNREVRRGIKARYRTRLVKGMSKLDRQKSTLYRKRIKNNPCHYCGGFTPEMHDDHYYPLAKGGTDHWFNLVRACQVCNQKKNARLASSL